MPPPSKFVMVHNLPVQHPHLLNPTAKAETLKSYSSFISSKKSKLLAILTHPCGEICHASTVSVDCPIFNRARDAYDAAIAKTKAGTIRPRPLEYSLMCAIALEREVSGDPLVAKSVLQHGIIIEFAHFWVLIDEKDAEIMELKETKELYEAEISHLKVLYH
ncbi:hypothetical protein VE00_00510 [Pseudogymnoascus sp. WSF 3629]|nr:hypothetical protein VE00_00510 [Pseudogymnoascus sp. WSF 3629]